MTEGNLTEKIILISTKAEFQAFVDTMIVEVAKGLVKPEWINKELASMMLGISVFTLNRWRVEGVIDFTQPSDGIFLYSRSWIENHLNKKSTKAFKK